MASFYDRKILPALLTCACSSPPMMKQRAKVVPQAQGKVLELGIGMGLNLQFYDPAKVESIAGVDPAAELRARAQAAPRDPRLVVEVADGTAEALPFGDASFDTVVCTFTLCSVGSQAETLRELRRILKPGGRLLYAEHGKAPDAWVRKWQNRIEPVWKRLAGGCHLTRPISDPIVDAGFQLHVLGQRYAPKTPKFAGWMEWGEAVKAG